MTTIIDLEDSLPPSIAADKVAAYRNWLGLMRALWSRTFQKDGKTFTRRLNADREYTAPDGSSTEAAWPLVCCSSATSVI